MFFISRLSFNNYCFCSSIVNLCFKRSCICSWIYFVSFSNLIFLLHHKLIPLIFHFFIEPIKEPTLNLGRVMCTLINQTTMLHTNFFFSEFSRRMNDKVWILTLKCGYFHNYFPYLLIVVVLQRTTMSPQQQFGLHHRSKVLYTFKLNFQSFFLSLWMNNAHKSFFPLIK